MLHVHCWCYSLCWYKQKLECHQRHWKTPSATFKVSLLLQYVAFSFGFLCVHMYKHEPVCVLGEGAGGWGAGVKCVWVFMNVCMHARVCVCVYVCECMCECE